MERTVKIDIKDVEGKKQMKIVEIRGVLDTLTTLEADELINPLIENSGLCLIADCSKLEYMNSTGLASLMRYYIQMQRREGTFKIINPSKDIYEIMKISGAVKLLEIYKTIEEAIASWHNE